MAFFPIIFITLIITKAALRAYPKQSTPILLGASLVFYFSLEGVLIIIPFFTAIFCISTENRYLRYLCYIAVLSPLVVLKSIRPLGSVPLGLSFFTLQAISLIADKKLWAQKTYFKKLLYLLFFPQLTAGPIEAPEKLIPQLESPVSKLSIAGKKHILFLFSLSFFFKFCIADRLALFLNPMLETSKGHGIIILFLCGSLFGLQLYFDFFSYCLLARACARTLGIKLTINFKNPYQSSSPAEFWRRWHVSFHLWLKKYIYLPIKPYTNKIIALIAVFSLSSLWHHPSVMFLLWGTYNCILTFFIKTKSRLLTLVLILPGWTFFWLNNPDSLLLSLQNPLYQIQSFPYIPHFSSAALGFLLALPSLICKKSIFRKTTYLTIILIITTILSGCFESTPYLYFKF
jgi:D-alanyl-lipoteichoic acid acyltransferase DltB (MBOAT superfamily)